MSQILLEQNKAQTSEADSFTSMQPHKVTYSHQTLKQEITQIETKSGLVIERGHTAKAVKTRRNLKDLFANFQINDLIEVPTYKEAANICSCMRYRGWKGTMAKQSNGVFKVQRLS